MKKQPITHQTTAKDRPNTFAPSLSPPVTEPLYCTLRSLATILYVWCSKGARKFAPLVTLRGKPNPLGISVKYCVKDHYKILGIEA